MKMSESRILSSSPMLLVLLSLLMASFIDTTAGQIGVCYGRLTDRGPNPSDGVALFKQRNIQRMRLYDPDPEVLNALRGSNIELVFGVPNAYLERIASSQMEADTYIRDYVKNYDDVRFRFITVGTEVKPSVSGGRILFQAMQNIEKAVSAAGLATKVTTAISMEAIMDSYPPSNGRFRGDYISLLQPVIEFLVNKQSPLFVNIYPFSTYQDPNNNIPLEYTLFKPTNEVHDGPYVYKNLFDAQLDSVYAALEKLGGAALEKSGGPALERSGGGAPRIVVSETGWPTKPEPGPHVRGTYLENKQTVRGANLDNAQTYINNLIQHVKTGSPRRPGEPIETYIFAMFDENRKDPPGVENNFGMFSADRQPKYNVNFN